MTAPRAVRRFLAAFVHRLKRVPGWLSRLIGHLFGKMDIEPNPYYAKLREIEARGHVTPDDLDEVIMPLLITRGSEIALLRAELRHAISRSTILYVVVVVLLVFGAMLLSRVGDLGDDNQLALKQLDSQAARLDEQQDDAEVSRQIGRATNCAIQSAVIEAAIATINNSVSDPLLSPSERVVRRRRASAASRAYALRIARAVEDAARRAIPKQTSPAQGPQQTVPNVGTIIRPDGRLDCRKLAALTRAPGG